MGQTMDSETLLRMKESGFSSSNPPPPVNPGAPAAPLPSKRSRSPSVGSAFSTRAHSTKGSLRDRSLLSRVLPDGTVLSPTIPSSASTSPKKAKVKKAKPRHDITQEALLTECAVSTEPVNKKWLLGRRRSTKQEKTGQGLEKGRDLMGVAVRSVSKSKLGIGGQAMYNTLTFPNVDDVPRILQRKVTEEDFRKGEVRASDVTPTDKS